MFNVTDFIAILKLIISLLLSRIGKESSFSSSSLELLASMIYNRFSSFSASIISHCLSISVDFFSRYGEATFLCKI